MTDSGTTDRAFPTDMQGDEMIRRAYWQSARTRRPRCGYDAWDYVHEVYSPKYPGIGQRGLMMRIGRELENEDRDKVGAWTE